MHSGHNLLRFASLKGRSVIARAESVRVGEVEDILFSPQDGRIGAILVNTEGIGGRLRGMLGQAGSAVRGEAIEAVGPDAIMCRDRYSVVDAERIDRQQLLSAQALKGRAVITDTGQRLGKLGDVVVNTDTRRVEAYTIVPQRESAPSGPNAPSAPHEEVLVPVGPEARVGKDLVTVPSRSVGRNEGEPPRESAQPPSETPPPTSLGIREGLQPSTEEQRPEGGGHEGSQ